MNLTGKSFLAILEGLRVDKVQGDKRRAPRVGVSATVKIIPLENDKPQPALTVRVRDVAKGGVSFLHSRQMKEGIQFALQLSDGDEDPIYILCEVRHARLVADRLWAIGGAFLQHDYTLPKPPPPPRPRPRGERGEVERIRNAILR